MNLEPKISNKMLWWDGQYGGVVKDGRFASLYVKPNLPEVDPFDVIVCRPRAGHDVTHNYLIKDGVTEILDVDEMVYVDGLIDQLFPDAGGGGGVADPRAIIAVDASGADPLVTLTRADGSRTMANFSPTIQNTPAYTLLVNNQGFNKSDHCNMVVGDGDANGVKCPGIGAYMEIPVWMYDKGGSKLGGEYDTGSGEIFINADSVEANWQLAFHIGAHPSWPKYSKGRPKGAYKVRVHVLNKQPNGSWAEVAASDRLFTTSTEAYPNTTHLNFNTSSHTFTTTGLMSGWYKLAYSVLAFGDDPSVIPYVRLGAVADGWMLGSSATHYFQVKGSIKATAGGEAIAPIPKP